MARHGHWMWGTLLLLALAGQGVAARGIEVASGPQRTLMIELFTSEGCSSCPPAEAFINRFSASPRLWRRFVPLAFHVDYWDYLGWKDRYALPDNAARQRRYAKLGHVRGVYTPGIMVNGRAWRPGWLDQEPRAADARAGELRVRIEAGRVFAHYGGAGAAQGELQLNLALLGMGLATDIRRGENAGRHAPHEFVVLAHSRAAGPGPEWQGALPSLDSRPRAQRLAVALWVSRPGDPTPLQATGGFLPWDVLQSSAGPSTKGSDSKP